MAITFHLVYHHNNYIPSSKIVVGFLTYGFWGLGDVFLTVDEFTKKNLHI